MVETKIIEMEVSPLFIRIGIIFVIGLGIFALVKYLKNGNKK